MLYLLDTNILLRLIRSADPDHALIRQALRRLRDNGHPRVFFSQNLVEFWNVCTRPSSARGGFGFTLEETARAARIIERVFELLPDTPDIHVEWRRIVEDFGVSGVQVHDARLAAAMSVYSITHVLTLNPQDFQRYPGISAVHPSAI